MNKKELQELAVSTVAGIDGVIKSNLDLLDAGNQAVLDLWTVIDSSYQAFVKDTGVDKIKGWELYFEPVLKRQYPKRGWSRKTKDSYVRVIKDPKKTAVYLSGEFELASGRKKTVATLTDDKIVARAVKTFNSALSKVKKNFTLEIASSGKEIAVKL